MIFNTVAIAGIPREQNNLKTHWVVYHWLLARGVKILIEEHLAPLMKLSGSPLDTIGKKADLMIVIGGDGNMLGIARSICHYDVPLIGINRGNLGFLTEISPQTVLEQLYQIFDRNDYFLEERFLLNSKIESAGKILSEHLALNEVVIECEKSAKMMDFEVFVDGKFAFSQKSDGLIIATPTGSSAYALSAGGPLLMPSMNALVLVSMHPHSLSSRPLVIDGDSEVVVRPMVQKEQHFKAIYDSQNGFDVTQNDRVIIKKSQERIKILHLNEYSYFKTLQSKLGWQF